MIRKKETIPHFVGDFFFLALFCLTRVRKIRYNISVKIFKKGEDYGNQKIKRL